MAALSIFSRAGCDPQRTAAPLAALAAAAGFLAAGWLLWEVLARLSGFPSFSSLPGQVWARFLAVLASGQLAFHAAVTLGEVLAGLGLGVGLASVLGYVIAKSPGLERLLTPYIVASQAVPIVAVAPLLVIWFGSGLRRRCWSAP